MLEEQGKSVPWLAEQSGAERSTVYRIIKGQSKNPKPETLMEFAEALGMSVEQLATGTDAASRVEEWTKLVPRSQYEEVLATMLKFEQTSTETQIKVRRATEEAQSERDRRIRCEVETESELRQQRERIEALRRERDEAKELAAQSRRDAERYKKAFEQAAAEIVELRNKITELGEVIDEGSKTGRVAAILAGTAAAASVLSYLNTMGD